MSKQCDQCDGDAQLDDERLRTKDGENYYCGYCFHNLYGFTDNENSNIVTISDGGNNE